MTSLDRTIILILTIFDALMDAVTLRTWSSLRGQKTIPFKAAKTE